MKCLKALLTTGLAISLGLLLPHRGFAQTAVTAAATPASLSFVYSPGNALPTAQTVAVKASAGTPNYSLAITGTNALWLTATPDTGKLTATLSVRVNPTSLAAGTYTANIAITVTGVAAVVNVPVTLVVNSALPIVALSTSSMAFVAPPAPPATQNLIVSTSGSPVSFSATVAGAPWLTVSPAGGVLLPGSQISLMVNVDPTGLAPQTAPYTGKITIAAPGASTASKLQVVSVSLTVSSMMPTISSIWPASVALNAAATTVTIRGTNFYGATVVKAATSTTPLVTTVLANDVLLATIPANLLNVPGPLNITVSNPAPGGTSAPMAITIGSVPVIQAVVNSATMMASSISPGELITLFGDDIGPALPATLADANGDGFVDTTISNIVASVDGVSAPLIYVSQNQITLQVPYEVTIGPNKIITVTKGLAAPATTTATIAATAPGIFTIDGSGTGQAAALNFNATTLQYSVNTAANPAKIGDTIVLYLTGEGDYATTITPRTGLLVPAAISPIPQMNPLPTVSIGGVNATVAYAGPSLGSILGLLQINVAIPAGATVGATSPVLVTIGGISTQAGTTISVK